MKVFLFTVSIIVSACSATTIEDQLQRLQQEVEQLKRSNEESITALKQTYDEKIASLEQQIRSARALAPQSGLTIIPDTFTHLFYYFLQGLRFFFALFLDFW